jgi:hypothetical protein
LAVRETATRTRRSELRDPRRRGTRKKKSVARVAPVTEVQPRMELKCWPER